MYTCGINVSWPTSVFLPQHGPKLAWMSIRLPRAPILRKRDRIGVWARDPLGYAEIMRVVAFFRETDHRPGLPIRQRARPSAGPNEGSFPMNRSTVANRWNLDLIEENYQRWRNDPASVDESWRIFFEGYELGQTAGDGAAGAAARRRPGRRAGAGGGHPPDRRLPRDRPLPRRPRPAEAQPRRATRTSCSSSPRSASPRPTSTRPSTPADRSPPRHPARADRRSSARRTAARSASSTCTSTTSQVRHWLAGADGAAPRTSPSFDLRQKLRILLKLHSAELFETFLHTHYVGPEAVLARRGRDADPAARRDRRAGRRSSASARSSSAWPTAAGSTSWPTSSASRTG